MRSFFLKETVIRLIRLLDRVLQRLIPAKPNRFSYISIPDYADNAYYQYLHCLKTRSNIEHIWLIRESVDAHKIQDEFERVSQHSGQTGNSLRVVSKYGLQGYWLFLTSKVVFHTHGTFSFHNSTIDRDIVNLWHGMPIKAVGALNRITPNRYPTFGTLHVATSVFFQEIIGRAFTAPVDRVKVSGLPRCDVLSAATPAASQRATILEALGLATDAKLILWLPTYRTERKRNGELTAEMRSFLDDIEADLLTSLNQWAEQLGYAVVVKPHPFDLVDNSHLPEELSSFRILPAKLWQETGVQLYDVLAISDALLSDISSVVIDFLVTGRPIGIIGFDADTYTRDVLFDPEEFFVLRNVTRMTTQEAIASFFERVVNSERDATSQDDHIQRFYSASAGSSAEAILQEIGC